MNPDLANEATRLLRATFVDRTPPPLDSSAAEQRRSRAIHEIQTSLSRQMAADYHAAATRRRWGETIGVVLLAAGLALVVGRIWPHPHHGSAVPAFVAIESKGAILCDRDDGKNWTTCDPSEPNGVVGLRTLEQSRLTVETVAGVRLQLAASSTLVMRDAASNDVASRATLTQGFVDVRVPKLGPNRQFVLVTPTASITVHGTAFSVEVKQDTSAIARTCVRLREGSISVQSLGRTDRLEAPATWGCEPDPSEERANLELDPRSDEVARDNTRRPLAPSSERSTLGAETKLLERALGAERNNDLASAERNLRQLLTLYPKSMVLPEARIALDRVVTKRNSQRSKP